MPWKYTSFIKAGRVTVPVEITLVPTSLQSDTEQWTTKEHMKEIRELLKPAVELALKCHNDGTGGSDKYLDHPYFSSKLKTALGYVIQNNNKYNEVVDVKQTWPEKDDEEEHEGEDEQEVDENTGLRDLGGNFTGYRATKVYIKASVMNRTESTSAEEEKKQLSKSLGVKLDAYHYFKPHNTVNQDSSPVPSRSDKKDNEYSDPEEAGVSNGLHNGALEPEEGASLNLEGANDFHNTDNLSNAAPTRSPATNNSVYSGSQINEELWDIPGDFFEEKDEDAEYVGMNSPEWNPNYDETHSDYSPAPPVEEEDEELPDIDFTPPPTPIISPVKELSKMALNKKTTKRASLNNKSKSPKRFKLDGVEGLADRCTIDQENRILGSPKKKNKITKRDKTPSLGLDSSPRKKKKKDKTKIMGKNQEDIFASTESGKKNKTNSVRRSRRDRKDSEGSRSTTLPSTLSAPPSESALNRSPQKEVHLAERTRGFTPINHLNQLESSRISQPNMTDSLGSVTGTLEQNPRPSTSTTLIMPTATPLSDLNSTSPIKGLLGSIGPSSDSPSQSPLTASKRGAKNGESKRAKNRLKAGASEHESNGKTKDSSAARTRSNSVRTPAQLKDYGEKPTTLNPNRKLRSRNNSHSSDTEDGVVIVHEKEKRKRRRDFHPVIKQESLDSLMPQHTRTESVSQMEFDPEMPVLEMEAPIENTVHARARCSPPPYAPTLQKECSSLAVEYDRPRSSSFIANRSATAHRESVSPVRSSSRNSVDRQICSSPSISTSPSTFSIGKNSAFVPFSSRLPGSPVAPSSVPMVTRSSVSPVRNIFKVAPSPISATTAIKESVRSPAMTLASIVSGDTTARTNSSTVGTGGTTSLVLNSDGHSSLSSIVNAGRHLRSVSPSDDNPEFRRAPSTSVISSRTIAPTPVGTVPPASSCVEPTNNYAVRSAASCTVDSAKSNAVERPVSLLPRPSRLADVVKSIQRQSCEDSDEVNALEKRISVVSPGESLERDEEKAGPRRSKRKKRKTPKAIPDEPIRASSDHLRPRTKVISVQPSRPPHLPETRVTDFAPNTVKELPATLKQIPSLKSILEQQENNYLISDTLGIEEEETSVEEVIISKVRQKSAAIAAIQDNYASDSEEDERGLKGTDEESSPDRRAYPGVYLKQMVEVSSQDLRNVLHPVNLEDVGTVTVAESELPFDAEMDLYDSINIPNEYNIEDSYDLFSYDDEVEKSVTPSLTNLKQTTESLSSQRGSNNNLLNSDEFPRLSLVGSPQRDSGDTHSQSPVDEPVAGTSRSLRRSSPPPSPWPYSPVKDNRTILTLRRSPSPPKSDTADHSVTEISPKREVGDRPLLRSINQICASLTPTHFFNSARNSQSFSKGRLHRIKSEHDDSRSRSPLSTQPSDRSHSSRDSKSKIKFQPTSSLSHSAASSSRMNQSLRTSSPPPPRGRLAVMPPPQFPAPRTPKKNREAGREANSAVTRRKTRSERRNNETPVSAQERAAVLIGDKVSPQDMSTRDIVVNKYCLQACMSLLHTVQSVPNSSGQVAGELGFSSGVNGAYPSTNASSSRGQDADVKMVCKVKNATRGRRGKIKQEKDDSTGRELVSANGRSSFDEEEDEDMRSYMRDHGTGMLKELIGRMENTMEEAEEYVPQGDEFDLSQSSLCMVRVFPGYAQNSRNYKIMAKKISLLTLEEVTQMYHGYVSVNLHGIIRGTRCSRRMNLYIDYTTRRGNDALRVLKDENILKPFTQEQIEHLMNLIAADFPANQSDFAQEQADDAPVVDMDLALILPYYVLLPESLMRIYAMVNQTTLKMAEEIMKWGAARDDKLALKE